MTQDTKNVLSHLLTDDTAFAVTGWNREDIVRALEDNDIDATDESVEALYGLVEEAADELIERMCAAGWDLINDIRDNNTYQVWIVEYTTTNGSRETMRVEVCDTAIPEQLDDVLCQINNEWDERGIDSVESIKKDRRVIA